MALSDWGCWPHNIGPIFLNTRRESNQVIGRNGSMQLGHGKCERMQVRRGGKILKLLSAVSPGLNGLSWDAIDSDAGRDDVEILTKVRFPATTNTDIRTMSRGAGTTSTIDAYAFGLRPDNTNQEIIMLRYLNGGVSALGTWQPFTIATNTWYWMRTQTIGTAHKIRVWEDGASEPSTWNVEATNSEVTAAGWVGFHTGSPSEDEVDIDFFSAGTDGSTAPGPA